MRYSLTVAAMAVGALAVPFQQRDMVNVVDMVYVTDIVTVTAGQAMPTPDSKPAERWGNHPLPSDTSSAVVSAYTTTEIPAAVPTPAPETSVVVESHVVATTPETTSAASQSSDSSSSADSSSESSSDSSSDSQPFAFLSALAPGSSGSSNTPAPSGYSDLVVYHHNLHRANHSSPDIAWSDNLAKSASDVAATCIYAHNQALDGGGYGQNIAAGVAPENISAIITDLFYNGEEPFYSGLYGEDDPDMSEFESWGHFSQIVWAASTHVGCATQHCPNGLANVGDDVQPYFTVCNYKTPGNFGGQYGKNIGKPLGHPTANWNTGK